jgi:hypothetical protein
MWAAGDSINSAYEHSLKTNKAVWDKAPDGGLPTIRKSLTINGKLVAYLDSPCYVDDIDEWEFSILNIIGDLCALRMSKDCAYIDSPADLKEYFISDLLADRLKDENLINERCRYFHWDLSGPLRIISAEYINSDAEKQAKILPDIFSRIGKIDPFPIAFIYGRQIKVILSGKRKACLDSEALKNLEKRLVDEGLSIGVSRNFLSVTELSRFNIQSEKALELGLLLHPESGIYHYDKYSAFHIIEVCNREEDLMKFCHSAIFNLAEYDREHHTQMLESLHVFLMCHRNIAQAARALYVHRNTLNYRINKIIEMIGLNIDDSEDLFQLWLSFHILEYYSAAVVHDSEEQKQRKPFLRFEVRQSPQ